MNISMSGTRNGEDWPPAGETVDLPTGEAQHLVASGVASAVDDEPAVETATAPDTAETRESTTTRKTAAKRPGTK
ncbi:hypothetical protein OG244_23375 [Streptomyces brevispora]|uniref:hypothetical protein n=1 Tax=Streptomyces brevispora TaxID=887462 RepID=UPI002E354CE7|nr:hypothetical protein [Streptomyces brevispora]